MKKQTVIKILFSLLIIVSIIWMGCDEKDSIISEEPEEGETLKTGCIGCHTSADRLQDLAEDDGSSGGSSGEG